MPHYKLTYFNARARAELIRLLFAAADVEYEDNRVDFYQWASIKPTLVDQFPFGQMPVLNIDGVNYCQSYAIAKHLAKLHGFEGKTDIDQLRADMIVFCIEDTFAPIPNYMFHEHDESIKEKMKNKFLQEQLPVFLSNLEKLLIANKGGDGYWVGDSLTWADLQFLVLVDFLEIAGALDQLAAHPKLVAVKERVSKLPKIAAWLAKRPHGVA